MKVLIFSTTIKSFSFLFSSSHILALFESGPARCSDPFTRTPLSSTQVGPFLPSLHIKRRAVARCHFPSLEGPSHHQQTIAHRLFTIYIYTSLLPLVHKIPQQLITYYHKHLPLSLIETRTPCSPLYLLSPQRFPLTNKPQLHSTITHVYNGLRLPVVAQQQHTHTHHPSVSL
jgi:hypothetical protein